MDIVENAREKLAVHENFTRYFPVFSVVLDRDTRAHTRAKEKEDDDKDGGRSNAVESNRVVVAMVAGSASIVVLYDSYS